MKIIKITESVSYEVYENMGEVLANQDPCHIIDTINYANKIAASACVVKENLTTGNDIVDDAIIQALADSFTAK